jgi:hypothetical protein
MCCMKYVKFVGSTPKRTGEIVFLVAFFVFMFLLTASVYYLSPLRFVKVCDTTELCRRLAFSVRGEVQLAS